MPGADKPKSGALFERYRAALLSDDRPSAWRKSSTNEWDHNTVFYPNMFIQLRALFVRVVRPIAVDHTEVCVLSHPSRARPTIFLISQNRAFASISPMPPDR